jgi:hypothetical protein
MIDPSLRQWDKRNHKMSVIVHLCALPVRFLQKAHHRRAQVSLWATSSWLGDTLSAATLVDGKPVGLRHALGFSFRGGVLPGRLERGRTEDLHEVGMALCRCPHAIEVSPRRIGFATSRLACIPVESLAACRRLQRQN